MKSCGCNGVLSRTGWMDKGFGLGCGRSPEYSRLYIVHSTGMGNFFAERRTHEKEEICMLLVGNGRLITRSEELPYLEDGAVVLDGEVVKEVGSLTETESQVPRC